jgi:predicted esterase
VLFGALFDPLSIDRAKELPELLRRAKTRVALRWVSAGHDYTREDEDIAARWMQSAL